ncbi:hypothetical protein GCM10008090_06510 [Arenicella chitinivorans]|uniref:DUF3096 domain-containing protein n=1 Tax=Arenicella chitinivorans TaxID=1329800 RepID=A0A918RKD5_9GAMM|nr:DUF3096 domain-containing protein [Arenicella chitinivorans]GHA00437.1 hypothetical protein GCM10008090_06510 [Arenicella chitinivorans]
MVLHISLVPVLSIVAGVVILARPKFLAYVVAIYLIAIGVIDILNIRF